MATSIDDNAADEKTGRPGVSYLLFGVLVCKKVEKIFVGNLLEKSIKKYKIKEKV